MMNLKSLTKQAEKICLETPNDKVIGDYFMHNNPLHKKPWREFNYWNGWYALTKLSASQNVLEIGTGFGQSTIALARGARENLKILISLDLGTYGEYYATRHEERGKFKWEDNLLFVRDGIEQFKTANKLDFVYRQFRMDTQNFSHHPEEYPDVTTCLLPIGFDLILIDGKHEEDGCYNDLCGFFPFGKKGCFLICDDFQCEDVAKSYFRFLEENKSKIAEHFIWKFLTCNTRYFSSTFRRDQGLMIKK